MSFRPKISRRAKVALGVLGTYTFYEGFMYMRTSQLIRERKQSSTERTSPEHHRFSSAKINGFYVNPFDEYRPQTIFEFLFVRVLEVFESLYGHNVEIHDRFPSENGDFAEVGDLLKTCRPDYELLRSNSQILKQCVKSGVFEELYKARGHTPPLNNQLLFTWLGQSCSLVQVSGINILTDPIFSDHLFANNIGPQRLVKSPMTVNDVHYATDNNLHLVLVSHNHPDHLDLDAVFSIGEKALWVVPKGMRETINSRGISNVIEMDWWETVSLNEHLFKNSKFPGHYDLTFVPAMHWSGRHVTDSNKSLWGSFILRKDKKSVLYHAGDTGYAKDLFEIIGRRYGPVALSLLPIGQYCPEWHQHPRHISPEESIKIASHLQSQHMMGIHFGTFKLSSEPILEPKNKLLQLAAEKLIPERCKVPDFGLTYSYCIDEAPHEQFSRDDQDR